MIDSFRRIWKISKARHKNLMMSLVFSFIRSGIGVTQISSIIIAVQTLTGKIEPRTGMFQVVLLAIICVAGSFATSYGEQINGLEAGFFTVADQRVSVGTILRKVPLGFFCEASAGKISATLTTTLSGVESAASMVMVGIVSGLFNAFVLFVFMLFYDWRIGILTGIGMVVYLLLVKYQMQLSRKHAPVMQQAQTCLAEAALTFLQGIKVTKAFCVKDGDEGLKKTVQGSCDANVELTRKSMPTQFAAGICIAVFESIILFAALYSGLQTGEMDLVKTIVLIVFSFVAYASLNQAGSMLSMIGILDAGLAELETLQHAEKLKCEAPEEIPVSNEIELQDVTFAYGEHEVLHHISAIVQPNALTALIGPSGSGKTTLCQLIARFRDVSSGKIMIGGADIRHMSDEDLMEKISIVFQHVYLFEDTIFNNIRFGKPNADLEEVRAAARAACCDEFIMSLPQGYDTVLDEGGSSLSGGEKQRISIARAILKDSPIIILDEATSALDAENEHEICSAIDALTKNKTVIMIAHRIQTVKKADHIIALRNGRIVQEGTHEELKSVPGLYADFLASREEAAHWQLNT